MSEWQEDKVSRLAAALAFFTVLSIPSVLTLAIAIAGRIVGEGNARQIVLSQAGRIVGFEGRNAIAAILETATQPEGLTPATAFSIALLFVSASGVFVQLQDALNTVWGVRPDPNGGVLDMVKRRGFSFLIVIGIGILLVLILFINSLISTVGQSLDAYLPDSMKRVSVLSFAISFVIYVALIAVMFKVIPDARIRWRDLGVGTLVTAALLTLGMIGLSLYFRYSDPISGYGAAGSLMALLIWVYYSAQMLFLGAEFTQVYANRHGSNIRPDEDAIWNREAKLRQMRVKYYEKARHAGPR